VFEGLARDGGLLVPEWVPDVSREYKNWASLSFDELAYEIMSRYCSEAEIPASDLRGLMKRSYETFAHEEVVPCVKVGDSGIHVMELFHGVSFSFKDVALQGLGNLYEYFLQRRKRRLTIICATSGDTGSAAICGLRGKENIDCMVLFPEGRVSPIQQQQMTSVLDPNVHCVSVKGTFDDCQNIVKALFSDLELKEKLGLGAVNSINWARIMFQITYYFYTYYKLFPKCDGTITFSTPTGNFGDVLAGYYAKRMGLPVRNLVVATNSNDILHRFFSKGEYDKGDVLQTTSPSMDIQISSNFERYLFYLFKEDASYLANAMAGFKKTGQLHVPEDTRKRAGADFLSASSSDQRVAETIKAYHEKWGYLLCPHSACGVSAVDQLRSKMQWQKLRKHEIVVLGTAHPAKFSKAVADACGKMPTMPPALAAAQTATTRLQMSPNSEHHVRTILEFKLSAKHGGVVGG
jgi:threonine synthase